MDIASIQFANADGTTIRVTLDNGLALDAPWPCRTWQAEAITAWLAAGNQIAAYVAPAGPAPDDIPMPPKQQRLVLRALAKKAGITDAQINALIATT